MVILFTDANIFPVNGMVGLAGMLRKMSDLLIYVLKQSNIFIKG